jgi:hypothetical protein
MTRSERRLEQVKDIASEFIESHMIREYLRITPHPEYECSEKICCKIIAQSPFPVEKKLSALREIRGIIRDPKQIKRVDKLIQMAEHAVSETAPDEESSVFMLNMFNNQNSSSETMLFLSYEQAAACFSAKVTDTENEWCRIDKWQTADGELAHKIDFYIAASGECWFFEDHELDGKEAFGQYFSIKHPDLNLPVPCFYGDILGMSGLPFTKEATLLITDMNEEKPLDPQSVICKIIDPKEHGQYPLKLYCQKFAGSISPLYRLVIGEINPASLSERANDIVWLNMQCAKPGRARWCAECGEFCEWFDEMPRYVREPRRAMLQHGLFYDENDNLVTQGRGVKWRKAFKEATKKMDDM